MKFKSPIIVVFLALFPNLVLADKFQSNEAVLDYSIHGEGAPLFLLHGGMETRESLKNQIDYFSQFYQVIALDSREHGLSSSSEVKMSYRIMMEDVVGLAAHLGLEKINLMGQSDGGIVALFVAIHHPELVNHLVLLGTNYHYLVYPEDLRKKMLSYKWDGDTNPKTFPGLYIQNYLKHEKDLEDFGAHLEEMIKMWMTTPEISPEQLQEIKAKTLIVIGGHGDIDLGHVFSMQSNIQNAQLFIVPGATHFFTIEKPNLLNKTVHDFLKN